MGPPVAELGFGQRDKEDDSIFRVSACRGVYVLFVSARGTQNLLLV